MIPDDNLAYPVLVTLRSAGNTVSSGSGFYLRIDASIFLVTAKHVLALGFDDPKAGRVATRDLAVELLSYSKDLPVPQRNLIWFPFSALRDGGSIKIHPTRDVAVIKIATVVHNQMVVTTGLATAMSPSGLLTVARESVKTFEQVLVGNEAILYGYPASLGLPDTNQFDPLRPLLRKALIAGSDLEKRSLVIDGPVYRGNSGGPVFEIEQDFPSTHYRLVGVITQFIPLTQRTPDFQLLLNSGYSIAEPMDFVLELVKGFEK